MKNSARRLIARSSFAASAVALGLLAPLAAADDLINNLDQPIRATTICGTQDPDLIWSSQSFTTPTRATLSSITTVLGLSTDDPDIVAEIRAGLDPSGPALATLVFTAALETADVAPVTLVPDTAVVMEPGEIYWIVLYAATTGSFGWSFAEGNIYTGPGAFASYSYSFDYGAMWIDFGTENPYLVQIEVTFESSCPSDFNGDGFVTGDDLDAFVVEFVAGNDTADFNQDGFVTGDDFDAFVVAFIAGC